MSDRPEQARLVRFGADLPEPPPDLGVAQIGGKAASLVRLTAAGLRVPPGAVLTTAFFEPWFAALTTTPEWAALREASPDERGPLSEPVKRRGLALALGTDQRETLARLRERLAELGDRFAVRSSSPEEDLGAASFAGGYETRLGVALDALEPAVRACFASSLDARVLSYKQRQGFDPLAPRIAVIVQVQIAAEIAGVGFSLHPLTNDYDEAVFDAAWGLGESVVSGAVSPDHFVVDKHDPSRVIERVPGAKQRTVELDPEGGVVEREAAADERDHLTLDDTKLAELTEIITRIEALYGEPVDIEWAWAEGRAHVLQARPITTWVPLPASMQTEPGARRRLYMDIALAGGLTMNAPMTPVGQSWMERFAGLLISTFVGRIPVEIGEHDKLWFVAGGRMYQDLSNVLRLTSPETLAGQQQQRDMLMAATLANIDAETYRAPKRPSWMSFRVALRYPVAVWRGRAIVLNLLRAMFAPRRARARYDRLARAYMTQFAAIPAELELPELIASKAERVMHHVLGETMPPLMAAMLGGSLVRKLIPKRLDGAAALADALDRGFTGNVVVEMGLALHRMSRLLAPEDMADAEVLARRLDQGELPEPFMSAWRAFLARYGWRGPAEVDLGRPRYADAPRLALQQLCMMGKSAGPGFDPAAAHAEAVAAREAAYRELLTKLGPLRRALLRRAYRWIDLFAGTRDDPKHHYLMFFAALRRRLLVEGQRFVAADRLDAADEVMDLTLDEIEAATHDPALDLRARREANTRFLRRLRAHVRAFPPVIDSRGRIVRPAARDSDRPGEFVGMPVSPGIARGPVKILHAPDEQPIEPGDVLVAHTTDPGWTPLFVNAAAIVLEVGGALQHGAVVAREYGKPCVAGISDLLGRFTNGQLVEVDGAAGIVRVINDD